MGLSAESQEEIGALGPFVLSAHAVVGVEGPPVGVPALDAPAPGVDPGEVVVVRDVAAGQTCGVLLGAHAGARERPVGPDAAGEAAGVPPVLPGARHAPDLGREGEGAAPVLEGVVGGTVRVLTARPRTARPLAPSTPAPLVQMDGPPHAPEGARGPGHVLGPARRPGVPGVDRGFLNTCGAIDERQAAGSVPGPPVARPASCPVPVDVTVDAVRVEPQPVDVLVFQVDTDMAVEAPEIPVRAPPVEAPPGARTRRAHTDVEGPG